MQAPLSGVRILDLSAVVSGPMATGILADQGAEVIKVETQGGDLTRRVGPIQGDMTTLFATINRGKRSIVLDLKQEAARAILRELAEQADVLVENFRPGAMQRLGFGYEQVKAYNPRIVYLSISGFGQSGPYAGYRVYDPVIQAVSGFADAHPDPDTQEPKLLQTLMCDKITALTAAQAITAALHGRQATGEGSRIELSMLDAGLSFLWPEALYNHSFLDNPPAPVPEFGARQKLWRCKDGWFAMIAPQDEEFAGICRVFGKTELLQDPRFANMMLRRDNIDAWRAVLEPIAAQQMVRPFVERLAAEGVPVGQVNFKADLAHDPQIQHNQSLMESDYPGLGRVRAPRAAARFNQQAADPSRLAPHLGEHTRAILTELGRSEASIEALYAAGVVR
ncbi:MAG: CoA transferase [Limnohabitans sp.]|nr:MAG: CoA transferase [Limnohabitans sp.]